MKNDHTDHENGMLSNENAKRPAYIQTVVDLNSEDFEGLSALQCQYHAAIELIQTYNETWGTNFTYLDCEIDTPLKYFEDSLSSDSMYKPVFIFRIKVPAEDNPENFIVIVDHKHFFSLSENPESVAIALQKGFLNIEYGKALWRYNKTYNTNWAAAECTLFVHTDLITITLHSFR